MRAGAQPYLGPRPAGGRRRDGRWGVPAGGACAAARSFEAVQGVPVAAGACREPAAQDQL